MQSRINKNNLLLLKKAPPTVLLIKKKTPPFNYRDISKNTFSSLIIKKIISRIMQDGKQFKVETIFKTILIHISLRGYSPLNIIIVAINNVKPLVDIRKVTIKGNSFFVPFPLKKSRQITKSIQILLKISKNKKGFEKILADEFIKSALGFSRSLRLVLNLHNFAFKNKAFSSYR